MQIHVNIELTKNDKPTKELMVGVDRGMDDLIDFIFAKSQELVPVDEATLKKSGHLEREFLKKSIEYDAPHASYLEYGTRPHFPPVQPLAEWAVRVLKVSKAEARQIGFLIARKIAAHGTEPQPFIRPAADEGQNKAAAIIKKAMKI